MWDNAQSSSFNSDNRNTSPLLINFNPFHILKPQIIGAIEEKNPKQPHANFGDVEEKNMILNGSFGDTKRDVETIDLLDNFFTTPHVVSKEKVQNDYDLIVLEDFLQSQPTTVEDESDHHRRLDKEFSKFFDQYEASVKFKDIKNQLTPTASNLETYPCNNTESFTYPLFNKPKVLVPKIDSNETKCEKVNDDEEQDPEDLLDEIILSKNLEKLRLSGRCCTDDNTVIENQVSKSDKFKVTQTFPNHAITRNARTNFQIQKPSIPLIIKSNHSVKLLETMKKDEKVFKKRRILTNEIEKMRYTKGPDLYEKSVVLPQIMQRLTERKKALDKQKNVTKRLILDAGPSSVSGIVPATKLINVTTHKMNAIPILSNTRTATIQNQEISAVPSALSVEVLMEDCNRERLLEFEKRRLINNFVRNGTFYSPE